MTIGADIKEVFQEVGTSFSIITDSGTEEGGYLDYEENSQVTKPFIREYFLEASFAYDTTVNGGSIIQFDTTGDKYIIMNFTPSTFENEIIENAAVLYKCNVSGELRRPSGEVRDFQTYQKTSGWQVVSSNCHGLLTENLFGMDLGSEPIGQIEEEAQTLYIPSSKRAKPLDRYVVSSGENGAEFYKIDVVERRKFKGVDVCQVSEDTRPFS